MTYLLWSKLVLAKNLIVAEPGPRLLCRASDSLELWISSRALLR